MKTRGTQTVIARGMKLALWAGLAALLLAPSAWALGTASGTSISNQATINYSVGGVNQTGILSDGDGGTPGAQATTFLVDDMVDLTVSTEDAGPVIVAPGGLAQVLRYTVSNTGNTTHDFLLSTVAEPNGAYTPWGPGTPVSDNFDAGNVRIYLDADGATATAGYTPSTWGGTGTEVLQSYVDELPADFSITVYIVVDIAIGQLDNDEAAYALTAQVAAGGAAGAQGAAINNDDSGAADVPGTVQIVFADNAGSDDGATDGYFSSQSAYHVGSAQLTVSKTSSVISDPFNGTTNPKAIPGAIIEYTITVSNAVGAGSTATGIVVTDDLTTEVVTNGTLAFETGTWGAGNGIQVQAPGINGGAATPLSNAADADQGEYNASTANTLIVNCGDLPAGQQAVVRFRLAVQ